MKFNGFNYPKRILDTAVTDKLKVRDFVKKEFFTSSDEQLGWNSYSWQGFDIPNVGRLFIDRVCMTRHTAVYYPEPYIGVSSIIVEWLV